MRNVLKVIALLLVLGAPMVAPEFLMQQAQAQELNANGLTDDQQAALDTAMQGSDSEIQTKLTTLFAQYNNNTTVKNALVGAAYNAASSGAVRRAVATASRASSTQQNLGSGGNNNPMANNGSGLFTFQYQNQFLTGAVRSQSDWTRFTILNYQSKLQSNPNSVFASYYQRRIDQLNARLATFEDSRLSVCVGGGSYVAGPYGTVTRSPC